MAISAGGYHTCVIEQVDEVPVAHCWGLGDYGQLGDGRTEDSVSPVEVALPEGVSLETIVAGNAHTCAIDSEGSVWCWGVDGDGGDEADLNEIHGPEAVAFPDGTRITAIDGYFHECALTDEGAIWCWGRNAEGQVGDSTRRDVASPIEVSLPGDVSATGVVTGGYHSCALDAAGAAWCWGQDLHGQLGDGDGNTDGRTPRRIAVPDGLSFVSLSAGFDHTCGIAADGAAWCWGEGTSGQLGDGSDQDATTPVAVEMPADVRFIALDAGNAHTCAIDEGGSVWCWGLGIQAGGERSDDVSLVPVMLDLGADVTVISAGGFHTCALLQDRQAICWGEAGSGQLGTETAFSLN